MNVYQKFTVAQYGNSENTMKIWKLFFESKKQNFNLIQKIPEPFLAFFFFSSLFNFRTARQQDNYFASKSTYIWANTFNNSTELHINAGGGRTLQRIGFATLKTFWNFIRFSFNNSELTSILYKILFNSLSANFFIIYACFVKLVRYSWIPTQMYNMHMVS